MVSEADPDVAVQPEHEPEAEPQPDVEEAAPEAAEPGGDAILDALWGKALESWEDEKPHGALLEYAMRHERLPDLAGRYRSVRDDPQKGELARKKLEGIVAAATQMLFAMKTPRPTKTPFWMLASAFATCAILLGWLAYAILRP